jgi:NADH dehydrogenase
VALRLSAYLQRLCDSSITLVDRSDSHVLASELHEVVSARVACLSVRLPLPPLLKSRGIEFVQDEPQTFDLEKKIVHLKGADVPFDRLILAPGSVPDFRANGKERLPGAERAYPFYHFNDACRLRMRTQKCFSDAAKEGSAAARQDILRFVVAGGGSTGVEVAGELQYRLRWLAREAGIDKREAGLLLLEASDHLVPEFGPANARRVRQALEKHGVEVRLKSRVVAYDGLFATLESGEEVLAPTLIWAAGVVGNPMLAMAGLQTDSDGRALVDASMQAQGLEHVYVVGDAAAAKDRRGRTVRPTGQAALQEADTVAWNIAAEIGGHEKDKKECHPHPRTFLVSCGGSEAIGRIGPLPVSGSLAWLAKEAISARYLASLGQLAVFRKVFRQKLDGYGHSHE